MKIVVFGLTVSSSWGNGHATLWRGLIRALVADGNDVTFVERDVDWYAAHRDLVALPGARLILYRDWAEVEAAWPGLRDADALVVTSYCPDSAAATRLAQDARGAAVFYDMDTPVTLARLAAGERVDYLPLDGLGSYDLVLSYTGGPALDALTALGARAVAPLYGHVDPAAHRPVAPHPAFAGDLSYLGTYAADRQAALERLFLAPAAASPSRRFMLGGSGYPVDFPWSANIFFLRHVAPPDHPAFFCSSRLTLNVTRGDMAAMGWCPSGRLFEAAACGVPIVTDVWDGLAHFFTLGEDVLPAADTADVLDALSLSNTELRRIAEAARARVLAAHSSAVRARELVALVDGATTRAASGMAATIA